MNKSSKIVIALALIAALAIPSFAATTGSLVISGSVPAILEITVLGEAVAADLPITASVNDLRIATVVERSNKKAGYTILLQSASAMASGSAAPALKSVETPDELPYILKYGGNVVTFSAGVAVVNDVSAKTAAAGTAKEVTVSFDGAANFLDESVYGDTLTFTIKAK